MAHFGALYGRICCSPIRWFETSEVKPRGSNFLQELLDRVRVAQDRLRVTQSRKKAYTNLRLCSLKLDFVIVYSSMCHP